MVLVLLLMSAAPAELTWTFQDMFDRADNQVTLAELPSCAWQSGLTHNWRPQTGRREFVFPLWAQPVLRRTGSNGSIRTIPGQWGLFFPQRGVWSAMETIKPLPVSPGKQYRFQVNLAAEGGGQTPGDGKGRTARFRMGIFWEDQQGRLLEDELLGPVVAVGPWLTGPFPLRKEHLEGKVPAGAMFARPYLFLDCPPDRLKAPGGFWVTEMAWRTQAALDISFDRSLLLFPPGDPMAWHVQASDLGPGTYYVDARVSSLPSGKVLGEKQYRRYVSADDRALKISDAMQTMVPGGCRDGGRYELHCTLNTLDRDAISRVSAVVARKGDYLDGIAGEMNRFVVDLPCPMLLHLTRRSMFFKLKQALPIYDIQLRVDEAGGLAALDSCLPVVGQYGYIGWYLRMAGNAFLKDLAGRPAYWQSLGDRFNGLVLEEDRLLAAALKGFREKAGGASPLQFGSPDGQRPWADFTTLPLAQFTAMPALTGEATKVLQWVALDAGSDDAAPLAQQVLPVLSRGIRGVLLPDGLGKLLTETSAGFSPTALCGPWVTMSQVLGKAVFKGRYPKIQGAATYCFWHENGYVVAAHALADPFTAELEAGGGEVTGIDLWGNARQYPVRDGRVAIPVRQDVVFYMGLLPGLSETINSFAVTEGYTQGNEGVLHFSMTNYADGPVALKVTETESGTHHDVALSRGAGKTLHALSLPLPASEAIQKNGRVNVVISTMQEPGKALDPHDAPPFEKALSRPIFWGKKHFRIDDVKMSNTNFQAKLTYTGTRWVQGQVRVVETVSGKPVVRSQEDAVVFSPGKSHMIRGICTGNPGALELVVILKGQPTAERYRLGD